MGKKIKHQNLFHRSQIERAKKFIRANYSDSELTLKDIARRGGSSSYHFARIFLAYTGETPFDFLRRMRLLQATKLLQKESPEPITEIALSVGYETPSSFNKAFKAFFNISPSEFRRAARGLQKELVYRLSQPSISKEIIVSFSHKFDVIERSQVHFVYLEKHGPFSEIAPPTWEAMFPLVFGSMSMGNINSFLGLSTIDKNKAGEEAMIYEAGVGVNAKPNDLPKPLHYKKIPSGRYAKFVIKGPYSQIWPAFRDIFKTLAEDKKVQLRPEFCIENYINDPKVTPEAELLTELLVPIH